MPKIIIKHLTGTKANQLESFELPFETITFGRNINCQVNYDPEKEDLVSRNHLTITSQGEDAFLLTDLNSSNGTFVNDKQVTAPVTLNAGDTVQLGKGGPKFMFELDPPAAAKKTREAESFSDSKSTRESHTQSGEARTKTAEPKKQGIGHETLERRIHETETTTRRKMINISAGIFTVIVLVAGYFSYQSSVVNTEHGKELAEIRANSPVSATEIFNQFGASTVLITNSWKLIDINSGQQVYHKVGCVITDPKEKCRNLPVYRLYDDAVGPFLTLEKSAFPIGENSSGSGFVVQENGFILTNRHVAVGWRSSYNRFPIPGALMRCKDSDFKTCKLIAVLDQDDPTTLQNFEQAISSWVPDNDKVLGSNAQGRHDILDVTFPKTNLKIPARLVRVSDTADVALIKIDVPQSLQSVQMDALTPVLAGDQITVMGYPEISPNVSVQTDSKDPFNRKTEMRIIPEPTVTAGNVGKVISASVSIASNSVSGYVSEMGDAYQLTINATGSGNSGGPVFNDKGHVIGIFTSSKKQHGAMITFAVPIEHGLDIMGIQKTIID